MAVRPSATCRPRETREIPRRAETRLPASDRYFQEERQILRRQRHLSRGRIRAPNNHRTNGSTNGTLHQLTEFQEGISRDGRRCQDNGAREGKELNLTVALAFVDKLIENENQYFKRKAEITEDVNRFVRDRAKLDSVNVNINTLDKRGRGIGGIYLTVLGTSADDGDGGQVGRGNRPNGLIPLNRPTCSEAAAGKNPVSHVGKIYNLLTYEIANHVYQKVPGIKEVYVWLLSQIGRPINEPKVAGIELILDRGGDFKSASKQATEIIKSELNGINDFTKRLTEGKVSVC